jgi:hypothetical protein
MQTLNVSKAKCPCVAHDRNQLFRYPVYEERPLRQLGIQLIPARQLTVRHSVLQLEADVGKHNHCI